MASGNWNANATWEQSFDGTTWVAATSTPTSASNTITVRSPHTVTVTVNVDADQLTIDSGGTVSVNNGVTFTIADGTGTDLTDNGTFATAGAVVNNGTAIINSTFRIDQGGNPGAGNPNSYTYNQTTGTLVFNNSSGSFVVDDPFANGTIYWPATNGPQNVTVQNTGGITMAVARTVGLLFQYAAGVSGAGNLTLNGTSQVNNGGFTSGSPTYGASSLLKYNINASYGRNGEWLPNATSGAGYPNNVQLSNNTNLDLPNGSAGAFFQMAGNLTIDSGSTMNLNGSPAMTQPLNVLGSIVINGTLTLSTAAGGDIRIGGNWTRAATGTFTPNGRGVTFNGTTTQTITVTGGGIETFAALIVNKSAGNLVLSSSPITNVIVNGTVGNVLQLLGAGAISLNGNGLTLQNSGGNILVSGGARFILGSGTFAFTGMKTITSASGGTLTFDNAVTVNLQNMVDFGLAVTTIDGTLLIGSGGAVITNPPSYGGGSTLTYDCTCVYGRGTEWSTTGGPGYPKNVRINSATDLNLGNTTPNTARQMGNSLTIKTGGNLLMDHPSLPMTAALTVVGDITIETGASLHLSTLSGGDLHALGNLTKQGTGTLVANSRAVFFDGLGTQTLSGSAFTFDYVRLNKPSGSVVFIVDGSVAAPGGGDVLQFNGGAGDVLNIGSQTFTLNSGSIGGTNAAGAFSSTAANLILNGTGAVGTIKFTTGNETLNSLTMNRTSGGSVSLGTNLLISGGANALNLTAGIVNMGANTLTMGDSATSTGAHNGTDASYVVGKMTKLYNSTPKSFTFDVGTTGGMTDGHTPASVNALAGSGSVSASVTNAHHPTLTGSSLNRYWSLENEGITLANLTFNYLDGDLPTSPPEATLVTFKIDGGTATTPVGSAVVAATNQITMTGATSFSDWTAGAPDAPTAVKMVSFDAFSDKDGVLLRWQTGREVDNLGFNLYREDGGRRTRVTPSLVAGSALLAGPQTTLTAGQAYSWWDRGGQTGSRYYLEDIDLNGTRTMHGPISPGMGKSGLSSVNQSTLLSELRPQSGAAANTAAERGYPAILDAKVERVTNEKPDSTLTDPLTQQRIIASGQAVKIQVRQSGWYRASAQSLAAAGLDPDTLHRLLHLYADGVEVPILVRSLNKMLGANGSIEFYGAALDTPGSDTRTYWLTIEDRPGKRIDGEDGSGLSSVERLSRLSGNSIGGPQSFAYTVERKDRSVYVASLHNGDAENFFGPVISTTAVTQSLSVQQVDPNAQSAATLKIALQGVTLMPHQVRVKLNGQDLGLVSFDNQTYPVMQFSVPLTALVEGQNTVTLTSESGETDVSVVDYVSLTYARRYVAENNSLTFSQSGRSTITVSGFTQPDINVYDITNLTDVKLVEGKVQSLGDGYAVKVPANSGPTRALIALTSDRAESVAGVSANQPSILTGNDQPGADLVIITHGVFKTAVEPLAQLRRTQGLTVAVVDVEDVYDEFSYGAHSTPAVKEFLSWTAAHWQTPPRYVLLVGDASLDPRNYLGYGNQDYVPTRIVDTHFLETASDDSLADFDADGLAEMAVGRLPVRTVAQAETVVGKIVNYVPGVSSQGALLIADHNDGYDFEGVNQQVQSQLPQGMPVTVINRGNNPPEQVRAEIISGLNQGPQVVNYAGHGSVEVWTGAGLLSSADAANLTNGNHLPLFVTMTCLNGFFQDLATESLAEAMLKAPQGGAVASWASSGLTQPGAQEPMDQQLIQQLYGSANSPLLGDAVKAAKTATNDPDVRRTWILFGDPTMRLR